MPAFDLARNPSSTYILTLQSESQQQLKSMESHCCKSSEAVTATAVTLRWMVHDWSADVRVVALQTMAEPHLGASPPKIHARLRHDGTL